MFAVHYNCVIDTKAVKCIIPVFQTTGSCTITSPEKTNEIRNMLILLVLFGLRVLDSFALGRLKSCKSEQLPHNSEQLAITCSVVLCDVQCAPWIFIEATFTLCYGY